MLLNNSLTIFTWELLPIMHFCLCNHRAREGVCEVLNVYLQLENSILFYLPQWWGQKVIP